PHVRVHRGRQQYGRTRGEVQRGQEVVGNTAGELADDVGGGGRNHEQVHARRQCDVLDLGVDARRELVGDDRLAGDRLEGEGTHEAAGRAGHDDLDAV